MSLPQQEQHEQYYHQPAAAIRNHAVANKDARQTMNNRLDVSVHQTDTDQRFTVHAEVEGGPHLSPSLLNYRNRVRNRARTEEQHVKPVVSRAVNNREKQLTKKGHEKMPSSDSCYSKSDNSSIHSDPSPRVPPLPPPAQRHYDTTSLSSMDTTSSIDLWNIRAMPNVRITRLDRPISLRPNLAVRTRPNVFDTLTDELIVRILSFLSTRDLMLVGRVSRKFYFLCWEPDLWRSINLSGGGEARRDADRALSAIFQIIGKNGVDVGSVVRTINLNGCSRLTDRGLALIARRCRAINQLNLQSCGDITNGGLLGIY